MERGGARGSVICYHGKRLMIGRNCIVKNIGTQFVAGGTEHDRKIVGGGTEDVGVASLIINTRLEFHILYLLENICMPPLV